MTTGKAARTGEEYRGRDIVAGDRRSQYELSRGGTVRPEARRVISEHASAREAFEAIDALSAQMVRTGAPSNAIELIVVEDTGARVARPGAQ